MVKTIYDFHAIINKRNERWAKKEIYRISNESTKPKYYVLDMFPYPSGA
jgi:leucyl-tRNA synthetase